MRSGLSAGDEVDAYCGKCKIERTHAVVALVDGEIAKILCKVCGAQHRYRRSRTSAAKNTVRTKPVKDDTDESVRHEAALLDDLARKGELMGGKPYSMASRYAQGDVIEHPRFGVGIVKESLPGGKLSVHFTEGEKKLIHDKK